MTAQQNDVRHHLRRLLNKLAQHLASKRGSVDSAQVQRKKVATLPDHWLRVSRHPSHAPRHSPVVLGSAAITAFRHGSGRKPRYAGETRVRTRRSDEQLCGAVSR